MTGVDGSRVLYLVGPEQVELRREQVPSPSAGQLLLRIDAATTCGTDLKVWRRGGHPRMLRTPCPFGHELSGTVAAAGQGAGAWREGDGVVLANSASCGGCGPCREGRENLCRDLRYLNGAFAEHLLVPERFVRRSLHRRPEALSPVLAALAEPLACVLHGLEMAGGAQVEEVAVLGAGPIGLMFVAELARRGHRVVVSDAVPGRLAVAREMGAAATVRALADPSDADELRGESGGGHGFGMVVEATGSPAAWSTALDAARTGGTVVLFGGCAPGTSVPLDTHRLHYSELTVRGVYHHRPATFAAAVERLADGALDVGRLVEEVVDLDGVDGALQRMAERRILKAAVRPEGVRGRDAGAA